MPGKQHSTLANFPNELVIRILELAAATSRRFCHSLCFVSSWTRDLALPHLLTTVVLQDIPRAVSFTAYISRNLGHAAFVRNLWLPPGLPDLKVLLQSCHRLVNLSVEETDLRDTDTQAFISPHFQAGGLRFLIRDEYEQVAPPRFYILSVFSVVTHFHIASGDFFYDVRYSIADFPRLTHLALPLYPGYDILDFAGVLASPTLMILVLVIERHKASTSAFLKFNTLYNGLCKRKTERLNVYIAWSRLGSAEEQWLRELEGHSDIWERAINDTEEWTGIMG